MSRRTYDTIRAKQRKATPPALFAMVPLDKLPSRMLAAALPRLRRLAPHATPAPMPAAVAEDVAAQVNTQIGKAGKLTSLTRPGLNN